MTTIREPKPIRVKNIFICSRVVFCASSRMMKLSSSVPPAHVGQRATSIEPRSWSFWKFSAPQEVEEGVVERPQVGVDLILQVAGQEAQLFARFDGWAG